MSIVLIAGLGNPGAEYAESRHNAGFMVIEALAAAEGAVWTPDRQMKKALVARTNLEGEEIRLLKPLDFMNRSGLVLGGYCRYYQVPVEAVAVIYDDITLEPGRLRITQRGGDAGHNGVADLLAHLGEGFVRIRIGIGPKSHPEMDLKDFVLGKMPSDHRRLIEERSPYYREAVISLVKKGLTPTMNQFNRRTPNHECDDETTL